MPDEQDNTGKRGVLPIREALKYLMGLRTETLSI